MSTGGGRPHDATNHGQRDGGHTERVPLGGTARSAEGAPTDAKGRPTIIVAVAWATPEMHELVHLELPAGATVADATRAAGLPAGAGAATNAVAVAIFGKRAGPDTRLADGDRVELCRPLRLDPDEARRLRARTKGHGSGAHRRSDLPADAE